MPRMKPDEKRELLAKKRAEIDAQLRMLDAKKKNTARKNDTRRKIIAGALALEHLDKNPNDIFSTKLRELLNDYIEPRSRSLFPFLTAPNIMIGEEDVETDEAAEQIKAVA